MSRCAKIHVNFGIQNSAPRREVGMFLDVESRSWAKGTSSFLSAFATALGTNPGSLPGVPSIDGRSDLVDGV